MEFAIIIGLVVYFIAALPASLEKARIERMRDEREERRWKEAEELEAFLKEYGDPLNQLPTLYDNLK